MAKLQDILPIYDILDDGCIIGDNKACISYCFEMSLPVIYTLDNEGFKNLVEDFRKFIELVGEETIFHKQDFYSNKAYENHESSDFIDQCYDLHFNHRPYLELKSYLIISKLPDNASVSSSFVSKTFSNFNEKVFLGTILNSAVILEKYGVKLKLLEQSDLLDPKISNISRYYNFSDSGIEEIKDIDFTKGIQVGHKPIKLYTIENLMQFPTEDITYNKYDNGLPVSNFFNFSYKLAIPHVLNQIIYYPKKDNVKTQLDKQVNKLNGYNYKGSNREATEEIELLQQGQSQFGVNYAYYHMNIMAYDSSDENIDKQVNLAFSESGFKKKENLLSRKDIFLGSFPSNAIRFVQQKQNLMCLMLDLEAVCFLNYEQNYSDDASSTNGVKLCDRIYGIPFSVDVFDKPKQLGWIKNQNAIVLAGSGGGKSFFVNHLVLNMYRQGAHFFCIDASFSYRLQCKMHNGVYLTYDDTNRISFNPFYLDWIDNPQSSAVFSINSDVLEENDKEDAEINHSNLYANLLSDKINVLTGLLISISKNENEILEKFEESLIKQMIFAYYRNVWQNISLSTSEEKKIEVKQKMSFDDFYKFIETFLPDLLEKENMTALFSASKFLFVLKIFQTGNEFGYLLNSMDERIKTIEQQRFVVIDVQRIRNNKILFSVVSILAMDLYNQKVAMLPKSTKKILCVDEAWQSISSPEMATFMKAQVKVIRKYGGQTLFISQELDDFISSEILKDSIINNSSIKIFADMGEFKQKFEPIKKVMSISDSNEAKIKSLNQNNRQNAKYKEVCICWEQRGSVYALEVPTELKAIYETDADEVEKILPQVDVYGVEMTAINYANR